MTWLNPFVDIYRNFGWSGISLAILVLTLFICFLCLSILIIYPKVLKIFKGDNYKSWDNMTRQIGKLEGDIEGLRILLKSEAGHNFSQHTEIFSRIKMLEDKVR